MNPTRRLRVALALLGLVTVIGTIGYVAIAEMAPMDALYMTVITITTVGYREVGGPPSGGAQIFTMFIAIGGVASALYTAAIGIEFLVERYIGGERVLRRMIDQVAKLENHVVLAGFGRVGRATLRRLVAEGVDVVVIDKDLDRLDIAVKSGALVIEGDATADAVLARAGIDRARALIAAVQLDSENLVITLSAKARNPDILVVARAVDDESEKKLYLAGADRVVAPQMVGAERLAALALRPGLAEFIDLVVRGTTVEFRVEEVHVGATSEIVGKSLRDVDLRRRAGALVLAVGDRAGRLSLNPDPSMVFRAGQVIIGIGTPEQLERLRTIVAASDEARTA